MARPKTSATTGRVEDVLQVIILIVVGSTAMAASFTHVHDWTMANSPEDTPDAFGWANAVISELLPTGSLLEVRRRSRQGKSINFPVAVLLGSMAFSLTANLAGADESVSGWLVAGLPAVAFMVLTKMVLGGLSGGKAVPDAVPVAPVPAPAPAAVPVPRIVRRAPSWAVPPGAVLLPIVSAVPVPEPEPVPEVVSVPFTVFPVPVPADATVLTIVPRVSKSVPVKQASPLVAAVPERRKRPVRPRSSTAPGAGTSSRADLASDKVLKDRLTDMIEKNPTEVLTRAGTLGVKRVAAVLGTGPDRARRLIEELEVPVPVPA